MISNKTWMTAQTPSGFAMPISGAAFGSDLGMTGATAVCTAPTYAVRDRHESDIALAPFARPGSTAWSPPTC